MTDSSPDNAPPVSFLDNPHALELFADGASGVFFHGGMVTLTFESVRVDHSTSPGPMNRVVVGRLTLPFEGAENLRAFLNEALDKAKSSPDAQISQGTPTIQ